MSSFYFELGWVLETLAEILKGQNLTDCTSFFDTYDIQLFVRNTVTTRNSREIVRRLLK